MEKTILVTGKDTFLGNEILQILSAPGQKMASTVNPRPGSKVHWESADLQLVLPWNRGSPLGAKNILSEIISRFHSLDQVWLVLSPDIDSRGADEVSYSELEEKVTQGLRGFFFLLKELQAYSRNRSILEVNFVLFHEKSSGTGPLSSCIYSGFQGIGQGALNSHRGLSVRGFESCGNSGESFMEYLKELAFSNKAPWGRWHIFQERKGLFPGMSKGGVR